MLRLPFGVGRWLSLADQAIRLSDSWRNKSDDELFQTARRLRWQVRGGMPMKRCRMEIAALVRETTRRRLGMAHYPVQLAGGFAMLAGRIAEMQTGEGKTITALTPVIARAFAGKGCHVFSSNDYLASRDAAELEPVYMALGLTVGCVVNGMQPAERRVAYGKDITYGTASEMGFDFLRDRLEAGAQGVGWEGQDRFAVGGGARPLHRGHYFALVDEADAVLIDEASTPLIISMPEPVDYPTVALHRWSHRVARRLTEERDFEFESRDKAVRLSEDGCRRVLLSSRPGIIAGVEVERLYAHVESALVARLGYHLNRHYIVRDGEIVIVDEGTGRTSEGRKWQDGLHQAIEAKERLQLSGGSGTAAQITTQGFFRLYKHLAGMTGTTDNAVRELKKTYHVGVAVIPTHARKQRRRLPPRVFAQLEDKRAAIVEEVKRLLAQDRAILVGAPSVKASEALSQCLTAAAVPHNVLNAKHHQEEAEIVARAGQLGQVTIATNMAGRGTDIKLADEVRKAGGLHVIAGEMHSSPRTDRQLIGRCARQADPGSYQFFVSLEDELFHAAPESTHKVLKACAKVFGQRLPRWWIGYYLQVRRGIERQLRKQRKMMLRQERDRKKRFQVLALDPYLEFIE
ncbi:preprotein translocase subunit SecA [Lignipirellula cremea]|uniref:Protein translocase subunit SecA n=1 Tax=Lignipirellula cremea TaxID=2528010 RepID=A0A518DRS4_9BACT|nr:translocase [Lignipirellula cremea]QDU94531.1 preprotein translocase subunit SecA [Lignipirellula cremea]